MGAITLQRAEKWFGDLQVIKGVDIAINDGEFVVFVGPSGCGKSTLLRMIAGLEDTSRGTILLDDRDVTGLPPSGRKLSMVFQSYALYPHMSVGENMGFGLKTAGTAKHIIKEKVDQAAEILELKPYLERRPKELSGGQRQRVAIGRAIVREPEGFLFDEPLSNLDAALRVQMRFEIARLHSTLKTTMIYVTHDQVEAMTLADRIVVLKDGQVMQMGTPVELYERPTNLFVAEFIGSPKMNILPCRCDAAGVHLQGHHGIDAALPADFAAQVTRLGIRPEHITPCDVSDAHCTGVIEFAEYLGSDTFLYVKCDHSGTLTVRTTGAVDGVRGQAIGLRFNEPDIHLFNAEGYAIRY
jgi:multiple sugar transport system ATP-binding protein